MLQDKMSWVIRIGKEFTKWLAEKVWRTATEQAVPNAISPPIAMPVRIKFYLINLDATDAGNNNSFLQIHIFNELS